MKVLVVEDEKGIVEFLVRSFKEEGYDVDHVDEGDAALALLEKKEYGLMILDLILPGLSGQQVLEKMRARKDPTPVIVLTSVDESETKTRILNAGADDYMVKPFSFVELSARAASVLRRVREYERKPEELVVDDLKMIPDQHLVTRADKPIKLRFREYALLAYLMRNKNKVISRSVLVQQVWDYNAELFSNSVDSHISLLRKKINKDSEIKLIDTVHGVGYVLRTSDHPAKQK